MLRTCALALLLAAPVFGQAVGAVQNTPYTTVPIPQPKGTTLSMTGVTAPVANVSICGTVADPTNPQTPDPCPAGLYYVFVSLETEVPGTILSAVNITGSYTTDLRTYTGVSALTSFSLLQTVQPGTGMLFFRKAANTPVTVTTTAASTFSGSPSYRIYARTVYIP